MRGRITFSEGVWIDFSHFQLAEREVYLYPEPSYAGAAREKLAAAEARAAQSAYTGSSVYAEQVARAQAEVDRLSKVTLVIVPRLTDFVIELYDEEERKSDRNA